MDGGMRDDVFVAGWLVKLYNIAAVYRHAVHMYVKEDIATCPPL